MHISLSQTDTRFIGYDLHLLISLESYLLFGKPNTLAVFPLFNDTVFLYLLCSPTEISIAL